MRRHALSRLLWRYDSRLLLSAFDRNCVLRAPSFSANAARYADGRILESGVPNAEPDTELAQSKEKQTRAPWHREGSSLPPVSRPRRAGAMVKGKLLTTPSRLLKLTLPLTTVDHNSDRKDVEPLALLVHPQQPLSYLERLIQSELPSIKMGNGSEKIPSVHFLAEDSTQAAIEPGKEGEDRELDQAENHDDLEESKIDGKIERTGVLRSTAKSRSDASKLRGGPGEGGVETYSGKGHEAENASNENRQLVRWSNSTDIGDFIRDAARGKEFAVEIEGAANEIRVGVPSFSDRTHYLRQRLRRISSRISDMAAIKKECDEAAHRSAQRLAKGGFGVLVGWWCAVYYLTFQTNLGWDEMEPWTYLVGLSGIMGGYLYFIYHNREISYRSALNITINRRLMKLYETKGFNLEKWEGLVSEGNELRREIKAVATEYDVEWNESDDTDDHRVVEALKKDREDKKERKQDNEDAEASEKKS